MRPWKKAPPPTPRLRCRASDVKKKLRTVWTSKTIPQKGGFNRGQPPSPRLPRAKEDTGQRTVIPDFDDFSQSRYEKLWRISGLRVVVSFLFWNTSAEAD